MAHPKQQLTRAEQAARLRQLADLVERGEADVTSEIIRYDDHVRAMWGNYGGWIPAQRVQWTSWRFEGRANGWPSLLSRASATPDPPRLPEPAPSCRGGCAFRRR